MKKYLYMAIGASALVFGACSEDKEPASGQETMARVVVTVDSPESLTRSDGTSATTLQYALYDIIDSKYVQVGEVITINEASYPYEIPSFDVVKGHTYGLLVWASAPNNPYTINWTDGTMTVIYDKATANTQDLDAFYAYESFTVEGDLNLSITMERPFAMINIGTTNTPNSEATSTISVTGVPESLNLITGQLSETTEEIAFQYAAVPTGIDYPIEGYKYLSFAYILAPKEGAQSTLTYYYKVGDGKPISARAENITLQANYKVNIYGDLPLSAGN